MRYLGTSLLKIVSPDRLKLVGAYFFMLLKFTIFALLRNNNITMTRKRATINVTGMNRDQAKSLMDSKFAFENMNIRVTARDEPNTSLAVTNEKGTRLLDCDVHGSPVGVFTCDQYFGIFSYESGDSSTIDHITVYKKNGKDIAEFFHWQGEGLGFSEVNVDEHRIETEVSVEASNSIRVYWVDGVHQPRVVDFMRLYERYGTECTSDKISADYFDFLPVVRDIRNVTVEKRQSGYFYSGTVQFAITEVINGNESNIAYYSPLYYASDDINNRGYKPDNTTKGSSFSVSFDCTDCDVVSYFIVYAIYRSSQDGAAMVVKREVAAADSVSVIMAGNEEAVDSSHLLFLNRQPMKGVQTITQKDGVMFLANWQTDKSEEVSYVDNVDVSCVGGTSGTRSVDVATFSESGAELNSQLKKNSFEIGHFKRGEGYMLGYQMMDKHGYWQHPRFIRGDKDNAYLHTMTKAALMANGKAHLPHFEATVKEADSEYLKVRPVVAFVDDAQKPCLYQGIVTPTIYSEKERVEGTCYSKLSPFTRSFKNFDGDFEPKKLWSNPTHVICSDGYKPLSADVYLNKGVDAAIHSYLGFNMTATDAGITSKASMQYGTYPASQHLQALGTTKDYNNEFQTSWRYRDVVFKTALIPTGQSASNVVNATKVYTFKVTFTITCTPKLNGDIFSTEWTEYFFVGKKDSKYYLVFWNSGTQETRELSSTEYTALSNTSTSSAMIQKILWTEGTESNTTPVYGREKVDEDTQTGTGYWPDHNTGLLGTFTDVMGGSMTVYASYAIKWTITNSDASKKIASYADAIYSALYGDGGSGGGLIYDFFGEYTEETTSATAEGDTSDVFTIDNSSYFVDAETVTLHSPDITKAASLSMTDGKFNMVGAVRMNGFTSSTSIVAQTAKLNKAMPGSAGFQNLHPSSTTSGRCAMALPNWCSAWWADDMKLAPHWAVPPFGVSDYLAPENDSRKISDRVASKLTYHQLSNYRFCDATGYFDEPQTLSGCAIEAAFGDTANMLSIGTDGYVYKPSEDGIIVPSLVFFWSNGPFYTAFNSARTRGQAGGIFKINKFSNWRSGQIWQQNIYGCTWINGNDLGNLLNINLVPMLTAMSVKNNQWNRGFWHNNGTVDAASIKYGSVQINGGKQNYNQCQFQEENLNDLNGGKICLDPYGSDGTYASDFGNTGAWDEAEDPDTYTVSVKYRSTPHAVIKMSTPLWDYAYLAKYAINNGAPYGSKGWKCGNTLTKYESSDVSGWLTDKAVPTTIQSTEGDYLWLVDIVNNSGTPSVDPSTAQWMVAGDAVDLTDGSAKIKWYQGDWYFQRFDCLRTYPETVEEKSQVVEIVSFMCETRRNLDGRYDTHGGKAFLQANPDNFNLINDAYTQKNNFFSYSIPSENDNVVSTYPTTLTWTTEKTLNSNVDAWTSVTGASLLNMEGDKGPIVHLTRLANNLLCFQPSGIAAVAYNERTPLATEEGMPVELAMSGKVDGKQYIANAMGALRNTNIITTDRAVYFVDSYNKTMCALSEGVRLLSDELGFHSWMTTLPVPWLMRMHYDRRNNSVMGSNASTAIVFSETLGQYESFMSYEDTMELINVQEMTLALHKDEEELWKIWEINGGEYNKFFGVYRDYWVDLLIGGSPTDKVFDNVEFRGDLLTDDDLLTPKQCPFNTIRAYNEYQDSEEKPLKYNQFSISNIKNRFRSWHSYVPRNAERRHGRILERMRNPWCHVVLLMRQGEDGQENGRAVIQELNVDYTE